MNMCDTNPAALLRAQNTCVYVSSHLIHSQHFCFFICFFFFFIFFRVFFFSFLFFFFCLCFCSFSFFFCFFGLSLFLCFFFLFFFFVSFFFEDKTNMLGFWTLAMVNSGSTSDAFTQKVAATGSPRWCAESGFLLAFFSAPSDLLALRSSIVCLWQGAPCR